MGEDEGKSGGFSGNLQSQFHYGTFQGVANYHPPIPPPHPVLSHYNPLSPVVGFPQPVPPPGSSPYYYGYQSVPGSPFRCGPRLRVYAAPMVSYLMLLHGVAVQGYIVVAEERPVRDRLPCCGLGVGWLLFIAGFFFGAIPWYLGAFILLFVHIDPREKPGYVACLIGVITVLLNFLG
ncbi:hypothetical protein QQ045_007343 [Rhodiola kirilowii]